MAREDGHRVPRTEREARQSGVTIRDVARAGGRMPQKSTYFYPKLITGLVVNPLW